MSTCIFGQQIVIHVIPFLTFRLQSPLANRGVTISLFGFGGGKSVSSSDSSSTVSTKSVSTAPPRGVPVISKWKQARDGSITGVITGSAAFSDGDPVTTSPIKGTAVGGAVVTTTSGSKYYLVGGNATFRAPDEAKAAANARAEAAAASAAARERAAAEKAAAAKKLADDKAAKDREAQAAKTTASAAKADALARQKEATEKAKRDKQVESKRATLTVAPLTRSPTISLFGLGGKEPEPASVPAPPRGQQKPAQPIAPKGVPTISGWKLNREGCISGRIRGSSNFRDGEQVTTSPIAQGRIESGSTVKTGSGSKYFLA